MTVSVGSSERPKDLAAAIYVALTKEFFDDEGRPVDFELPDKLDTQDDPFDRHVTNVLRRRLPDDLFVISNTKSLVNPDIVVARPSEYHALRKGGVELDDRAILAIEVKKLERDASGRVSRGSGGDYNSTPPSELVKVIAEDKHSELMIPACYLFVLRDPVGPHRYTIATLALVTGAALNRDVEFYLQITGIRQKAIGLGTYGDGADRQRPMLVFANPLGWPWLTDASTLIARRGDLAEEQPVRLIRKMTRTVPGNGVDEEFWCYRSDAFSGEREPDVRDPFPAPLRRSTATTPRGRFVISFSELT